MERVISLINGFSLRRLKERIKDYFILTKPRVVYLVLFTAFTSMILAAENALHFNIGSAVIALLCIAAGAGGAGAINMWYDSDIDEIMSRTRNRPIPAGKISGQAVLIFGLALSFASVLLMGAFVNILASALLTSAIFYYSVIYTVLLKRRTPQNIVIGGGAGAFPPLIGWAAMTGSVSLESLILFLIIFFWTPPHFWALALKKSNYSDYLRAEVPMLPIVAGAKQTKIQIIIYSFILAAVAMLPFIFNFSGIIYLAASLILNILFLYYAFAVYKDEKKYCMKMFYFSIMYLFTLFIAMIIDNLYYNFLL